MIFDLNSPFIFNIGKIQWVYTPKGIIFPEKIQRGDKAISNIAQSDQSVSNVLLLNENKDMVELTCSNGNIISVDSKLKLYTQRGWVEAVELKKEDLILHKYVIESPNINEGKNEIPFKQNLHKNAMPIFVPNKNSKDLSEWIGMFLVAGYSDLKTGKVSILLSNEIEIERYKHLCTQLFRISPLENQDKRENRKTEFYFVSRNVVRFIQSFFNQKQHMLKLPPFLLEGSNEEHLSFLKGISIGSKLVDSNVLFFSGTSKNLADSISLILRHNGFAVSVSRIKNREKGRNNQDYYHVKIMAKHPLSQAQVFFHEDTYSLNDLNSSLLVDIANEINNVQLRSFEDGYVSLKQMKKNNKTICTWKTARHFKIDMSKIIHYFVPISKIVHKKQVQVSIKVMNTYGFVVNNVVLGGKIQI